MWTLFVSNLAAAKTGDEYIRLFIQFDELFSFSAWLLWLMYLFGDIKRAGMLEESWVSIVLKGVAIFVFAGPGVTIGAGWLWRERWLATKWDEDTWMQRKKREFGMLNDSMYKHEALFYATYRRST
jgi:hypothetical protein